MLRIRIIDNLNISNNVKEKYFCSIFSNRRINDSLNDIKKFGDL